MNIEELVKKHSSGGRGGGARIRAALTEQAETHAISECAYKMRITNLERRIRELEARNNDFERMLVALCAHIENSGGVSPSTWGIKGLQLIEQAAMLAAAPKKEGSDAPVKDR